MEDAKDEAERTTERMWDSLQEGRRAARGSKKRSEAVGASLDPDVSPEGLGGGQDLSEACIFKNGSSLLLFGSFQTAVHFLQHIIVKIIRLVMGFKLTTS